MTHITSCRNIISIEHTTGAVLVLFSLVLLFRVSKNFLYALVKNDFIAVTTVLHTELYSFQNLSPWFIFKKFI